MKPHLKIGLKIFLGMVIGGAPFVVASILWWSGIAVVAIFAVIVGSVATSSDGVKVGAAFSLGFVVLGTAAVAVSGSPLLAAMLVAACAFGIAIAATYSLAATMVFVAMYIPYLVHSPPATISGGPRGAGYYFAVAASLAAAGAWGCLLAWYLGRGKPIPAHPAPVSMQNALRGGLLLAVVVGLITFVAIQRLASTEWVWLLLTIFILTKPTPDLNWTMTRARITGTFLGVAGAALIGALGLPPLVMGLLGVIAITVALTLMLEGRPYWLYASFLTPAVIFFDSASNDTPELALQRLLYTVVGAVFAIALAAAINAFSIHEEEDEAKAVRTPTDV